MKCFSNGNGSARVCTVGTVVTVRSGKTPKDASNCLRVDGVLRCAIGRSGRIFALHDKSNKAAKASRAASHLKAYRFRSSDASACKKSRDFQAGMGKRIEAR